MPQVGDCEGVSVNVHMHHLRETLLSNLFELLPWLFVETAVHEVLQDDCLQYNTHKLALKGQGWGSSSNDYTQPLLAPLASAGAVLCHGA